MRMSGFLHSQEAYLIYLKCSPRKPENSQWDNSNQVDHVYRSMVTNISVRVYIENENL